ncbi:hypothetical protein FDP22_05930 [Paroceanicella profunda]|uniref:DUF4177 domain-containing protein n=1 Tax=Paroceanicella profunda TaxID=2579971 RepID=A0A5B8FGT4_9RHOB|nr:hypothetical protein [Paroceanicella profunda]QDL91367.1 hypothetical protein FDP22_05930 [Paroceanicella profunda]
MTQYEYKIVAAPRRAQRLRGRTGADRFAATVADVVNAEASGGWEYFRSDALIEEARQGWFRTRQEHRQSLLVFRRVVGQGVGSAGPEMAILGATAAAPAEEEDLPSLRAQIRARATDED